MNVVLDLDLRAAVDEDVDLLLLLVLVTEGHPEAGADPEVADARVLHFEGHARHPELEIRRKPEVGRLVVDVFLEVDVCVIAHGGHFGAVVPSEAMKELLL